MDELDTLLPATAKMESSLEQLRELRAQVEEEREVINRVRRNQRIWWLAVFLLGVGVGFLIAEWLIDPVSIILPNRGIAV